MRCFWVTDTTETYPVGQVGDDVEPVLGPANGGLMGSRELQGGRMVIIKRPQVAKFMFIWAARRKSFPVRRNGDKTIITDIFTSCDSAGCYCYLVSFCVWVIIAKCGPGDLM